MHRSKVPLGLLTAVSLLVYARPALAEDGDVGLCPITILPLSSPEREPPIAAIGYQSNGYAKTGLIAPEPVPIGVMTNDKDVIQVHCGGSCTEYAVPGCWSANWTRSTTSGVPGHFLDALAQRQAAISDAQHVLYLPSADVAPGATCTAYVHADLVDLCAIPGFADAPAVVTFEIVVTRQNDPGKTYDVTVTLHSVVNPPGATPQCGSQGTICELFDQNSPHTPPAASITAFPSNGMVLGETRMLQSVADDIDLYHGECGTPVGHSPVDSNYDFQLLCDSLTYTWSVVSGPGAGVFVRQGRSALFKATEEGSITVELKVLGTDGEFAVDQRAFMIEPLRVDRMTWGHSFDIAKDLSGTLYAAPHWLDVNDDGDAMDETTTPPERRIPAAYKRGERVEIQRVFIDCTTPAPPSAVLRGTGPDGHVFKVAAGVDPTSAIDELVGLDVKSSTALPATIKHYSPYRIRWEVSFAEDEFVDAGATDTPVYVVLDTPTPQHLPYESVYDISCKAADGIGASSEAAVVDAIWSAFTDQTLNRKPFDGFNKVDGKSLKYWPPGSNPPVGISGMLAESNGRGQCSGFAELFQACCTIHGLSGGDIYEVGNPLGGSRNGFLVKNWTVNTTATTGLMIGAQIVDAPGVAAQGPVANPRSLFELHYIVVRGGRIYDPSYGSPIQSSFNAWENAAIEATTPDSRYADLQDPTREDLVYRPAGF